MRRGAAHATANLATVLRWSANGLANKRANVLANRLANGLANKNKSASG